ncbi:GNAT family N-acetyltransferase [Streptomyces sp. NRRL B-1347]|uniref:GNAT family N-acetyltransferase n=1 Tax=Streptomyces sp. NRRL B-1347 TaxID=1476877 RepID=UPI0004C6B901|nr:GNAT family N-acetyltransferase [Streptomyces sp. NRRL B-1347]
MHSWTITPEPVTADGIDEAIRAYYTEIGERVVKRPVTPTEIQHALDRDPHHDLAPPHGRFLTARDTSGRLLGCVGVRLLDRPATAELKRMYVLPAGRGQGLGRHLLKAAEASARALGATRIVCETNTELAEARTLYTGHGYRETAPYNDHAAAEHWYAKDLA